MLSNIEFLCSQKEKVWGSLNQWHKAYFDDCSEVLCAHHFSEKSLQAVENSDSASTAI